MNLLCAFVVLVFFPLTVYIHGCHVEPTDLAAGGALAAEAEEAGVLAAIQGLAHGKSSTWLLCWTTFFLLISAEEKM